MAPESKESSAAFIACTISENCSRNEVGYVGSGVYCGPDSRVTLDDCRISGNSMEEGAGGVRCISRAWVTLRGCRVFGNSGNYGAIHAYGPSQVLLEGCSIVGNHAAAGGCAVNAGSRAQVSLVNCEIAGNRAGPLPGAAASVDGAVIFCHDKVSPTLTHCTIAGNSVDQGGVIACNGGSPVLESCVIWGSTPNTVCGSQTSCLVDGDPLFLDPGAFDFERFRTVTVGGTEFQIPDFIVEEPDCYLRAGSPRSTPRRPIPA